MHLRPICACVCVIMPNRTPWRLVWRLRLTPAALRRERLLALKTESHYMHTQTRQTGRDYTWQVKHCGKQLSLCTRPCKWTRQMVRESNICTCFHMHALKSVSEVIPRKSEGFASFLISTPLSKAQDGGMESGREIKERQKSHRRRRAWRELKRWRRR